MYLKQLCWIFLWFLIFEQHEVNGNQRLLSEIGSSSSSSSSSSEQGSKFNWFFTCNNPLTTDPEFLAKRGLRYQEDGKYDDALNCFTKAIINSSDNVRYYRLRGECYREMGNWNRAITDYIKILEKDPNNEDDIIVFSRLLFNAGNYVYAAQST